MKENISSEELAERMRVHNERVIRSEANGEQKLVYAWATAGLLLFGASFMFFSAPQTDSIVIIWFVLRLVGAGLCAHAADRLCRIQERKGIGTVVMAFFLPPVGLAMAFLHRSKV